MASSFWYIRWISSSDPLHDIVPLFNNMVLWALKYGKRIDFMLSVFNTHTHTCNAIKHKMFRTGEYV